MLSPKYAKMFLAEAEQLAKKYKLKPPTHVNSTKGAYSNSLDSSLSQNTNIMPVPAGVSGHDVSVLQQRPVLSGALANPIPSTVADITSAIVTGSQKGLEQAKSGWKKWIKGLGLASALSAGLVGGTHVTDSVLTAKIMKGLENPYSSEIKNIMRSDIFDKMEVTKEQSKNDVFNIIYRNSKDDKGVLLNYFGKEMTPLYNGANTTDLRGYNYVAGHGNFKTGKMRKGYTKKEASELAKKGINVSEGIAMSGVDVGRDLLKTKGYNPNLPIFVGSCDMGSLQKTFMKDLANTTGTPVIAPDGFMMSTEKRGAIGIADSTFGGNKNKKLNIVYPEDGRGRDIKIPFEEFKRFQTQLTQDINALNDKNIFERVYQKFKMLDREIPKTNSGVTPIVKNGRVVHISAGHSNVDPGAVNGSYTEANITREIRNEVSKRIKEQGYSVTTDGEGNINMPLKESISLGKQADFAVEFHLNSGGQFSGTEVFTQEENKGFAASLNKAISEGMSAPRRGEKTPSQSQHSRLGFVEDTNGVLVETFNLANKEDLDKYLTNKEKVWDNLAESIIKQLEEGGG